MKNKRSHSHYDHVSGFIFLHNTQNVTYTYIYVFLPSRCALCNDLQLFAGKANSHILNLAKIAFSTRIREKKCYRPHLYIRSIKKWYRYMCHRLAGQKVWWKDFFFDRGIFEWNKCKMCVCCVDIDTNIQTNTWKARKRYSNTHCMVCKIQFSKDLIFSNRF